MLNTTGIYCGILWDAVHLMLCSVNCGLGCQTAVQIEFCFGHINEAIAILPDSPRLLIIRAFFQLIIKNVTAGVRSSHMHL
jgi:hypothetical protein